MMLILVYNLNLGEVVAFMDCHCECTKGWLEPLLFSITEDNSTLAAPVADDIDARTFQWVCQVLLIEIAFWWGTSNSILRVHENFSRLILGSDVYSIAGYCQKRANLRKKSVNQRAYVSYRQKNIANILPHYWHCFFVFRILMARFSNKQALKSRTGLQKWTCSNQ